MHLRSIASTWYEAVMVNSYGAKLENTYYTKRDIQKAIKETNQREVERGYNASEYFILLCNCVRLIDDNGDVVSETITKVRA